MMMAGRGRRFLNNEDKPVKVGVSSPVSEDNATDLPSLVEKINNIKLCNIDQSHMTNIHNSIKQLFKSKEVMKEMISELHTKALKEAEFGEKLIIALEEVSNFDVDGALLRDELLCFVQNDFLAKEQNFESDRQKFVNSVLLLGHVYHRIKVCGVPIVILGFALLEYFDLLIKGEETEFETLAKLVYLNGSKLDPEKQDNLSQKLRTALVENNLNSTCKCWILLAIDYMSNECRNIKGSVREFYEKQLGDKYTKLETLASNPNVYPLQLPLSVDSVVGQNSTSSKNKNFYSPPSKSTDSKKDLSKKFSNMNMKSGNENKSQKNSPPSKFNKKDNWKQNRGNSSGHDDRFEKDENYYGVQKPRQPKPEGYRKKTDEFKSG